MNIHFRPFNVKRPLAAASVLLLSIGAAQAGTIPPSMRDAAQPAPREQAQPRDQGSRDQGAQNSPAPSRQQGPPRGNAGQGNAGRGNGNGSSYGTGNNGNRYDNANGQNGSRGYNRPPSNNWSTADGRHNYRPHPPRRYVPSLPYGHARYNWNGRPYYYYGGSWYRPYGAQFAIVSPPFGLFVNTLPSYYSSLWYGGTRYFYADNTYYLYEPARSGYVVTRSPYNDDAENGDDYDDAEEELYIYPARGQTEQQQADDRYECHRWAADQTKYDPVESEYDAAERAEYQRAMTACLTGRGYSVR